METLTIKDLADLGASGFLILAVIGLWRSNNSLQDRIFQYLEEARRERHKMAQEVTALKLESDHRRQNGG